MKAHVRAPTWEQAPLRASSRKRSSGWHRWCTRFSYYASYPASTTRRQRTSLSWVQPIDPLRCRTPSLCWALEPTVARSHTWGKCLLDFKMLLGPRPSCFVLRPRSCARDSSRRVPWTNCCWRRNDISQPLIHGSACIRTFVPLVWWRFRCTNLHCLRLADSHRIELRCIRMVLTYLVCLLDGWPRGHFPLRQFRSCVEWLCHSWLSPWLSLAPAS